MHAKQIEAHPGGLALSLAKGPGNGMTQSAILPFKQDNFVPQSKFTTAEGYSASDSVEDAQTWILKHFATVLGSHGYRQGANSVTHTFCFLCHSCPSGGTPAGSLRTAHVHSVQGAGRHGRTPPQHTPRRRIPTPPLPEGHTATTIHPPTSQRYTISSFRCQNRNNKLSFRADTIRSFHKLSTSFDGLA